MPIRLGAERHDQRVDAEDADADAVGEADERAPGTKAISIATAGPWIGAWVATMKALIVATVADREVDAAGQHRHGLAAGEDGERDGELHRVGDPALVDDAGAEDLQHHDQQRRSRTISGTSG